MKRIIERNLLLVAVLVVSLLPAAQAQINPVRLKVTKETQKSRAETRGTSYRQESQTISYTVEVSNASAKPVDDVLVRWAVLYKPNGYSYSTLDYLQVAEGEKTCSLGLGQKFMFQTEPIELTGTANISAYSGRYKSGYNAQIIGYSVEVLVKGAVVTSDIQPSADTKHKIEQVKKRQEAGPGSPNSAGGKSKKNSE